MLPASAYPGKDKITGAFDAGWLQSPDLPKSAWRPVNPGLGPGERSAIAIALQLGDSLLIVDDRAARAEAQSLGLAIIGTAAVIGLAKQQGLISAARPILERLQPAGYFIHLPCHPSLSTAELDWMITAVQKVGAARTA